jgi:hypothetical protein
MTDAYQSRQTASLPGAGVELFLISETNEKKVRHQVSTTTAAFAHPHRHHDYAATGDPDNVCGSHDGYSAEPASGAAAAVGEQWFARHDKNGNPCPPGTHPSPHSLWQ